MDLEGATQPPKLEIFFLVIGLKKGKIANFFIFLQKKKKSIKFYIIDPK